MKGVDQPSPLGTLHRPRRFTSTPAFHADFAVGPAIKIHEQGYKTAFRTMTNDRQQGKVLGEFAVKKLGSKRVAIIDDRSAYGPGMAVDGREPGKGHRRRGRSARRLCRPRD